MAGSRLIICATCRSEVGAPTPNAIVAFCAKAFKNSDIAADFIVASTECLGACEKPRAIAIQGYNKATYVFSGVSVINDIADIIATCQLYAKASDGLITDARPCGRLRNCLRARVPAISDS